MRYKIHKIVSQIKMSSIYISFILNKRSIICLLLTLTIFSLLKITGIFDWETFISASLPTLVSLYVTLIDAREYTSNVKIMSLCYDYMHKKEGVSLDDILGILISNKYRSKVRQPTNSFFDILEEKCSNGEVEEKRRIAEAIPMLLKLNRYRTKIIIERLRDDYDREYHDDNRRRVIESFRYCSRLDVLFVKKMLEIREGDSIYTIVAIVEVIVFSNIIREKNKENELVELKYCVENKFTKTQREFINEAIQFFCEISQIKKCDKIDFVFEKYMDKFLNSKFYMKILISKNIINICPYHEQCKKKNICLNTNCKKFILEFFDLCINDEKNVRRPMAKEDVCYCLLRMMKFPEVKYEARERILKLVMDDDAIIPITVLDYIYDFYEKEPKLYKEIINYCINTSKNSILKMRAIHIMNMIGCD